MGSVVFIHPHPMNENKLLRMRIMSYSVWTLTLSIVGKKQAPMFVMQNKKLCASLSYKNKCSFTETHSYPNHMRQRPTAITNTPRRFSERAPEGSLEIQLHQINYVTQGTRFP